MKTGFKTNSFTATLVAFSFLGVTVAQAQINPQPVNPNPNDLILGFTSDSASADYMLDLGQLPGGSGSVQLGGISMSTFDSVFGSPAGVNVGVVGAQFDSDIYATALRTGSNPSTIAGTEQAPIVSVNGDRTASTFPNMLTMGVVNKTSDPNAPQGFSEIVAQDPTTPGSAFNRQDFTDQSGVNPLTAIGDSEVVTLDLWKDTVIPFHNLGWVYEGNLQIDVSGSNLSVVYSGVPEPATYGVLTSLGLLVVGIRRQIVRNA